MMKEANQKNSGLDSRASSHKRSHAQQKRKPVAHCHEGRRFPGIVEAAEVCRKQEQLEVLLKQVPGGKRTEKRSSMMVRIQCSMGARCMYREEGVNLRKNNEGQLVVKPQLHQLSFPKGIVIGQKNQRRNDGARF